MAWAYLGVTLVVTALLWLAGDRWWPATVLTFGPRWVLIVPLPILMLGAIFVHRRALISLSIAGLIAGGPVMGFCLPWRTLFGAPADERVIRVLSLNVGEGTKMEALAGFVDETKPDIVTFVEWGDPANAAKVLGKGWHYPPHGGVFIATRFPITESKSLESPLIEPWNHPAFRCDLDSPSGPIHVIGVHLETPREGLQEVILSKGLTRGTEMKRTTAIREVESEMASVFAAEAGWGTIVAGDFNMPVDSRIYREYWSGWQNAFSIAGFGLGHTKYTHWFGIRIDHVLADSEWRVLSARVGPDLGGDHRPVVVELERR